MTIDPSNKAHVGMNIGNDQKEQKIKKPLESKTESVSKNSLKEDVKSKDSIQLAKEEMYMQISSYDSNTQIVMDTYKLIMESISRNEFDFTKDIKFLETQLENKHYDNKKENIKLEIETIKDFVANELPEIMGNDLPK